MGNLSREGIISYWKWIYVLWEILFNPVESNTYIMDFNELLNIFIHFHFKYYFSIIFHSLELVTLWFKARLLLK